MLIPSDWSRARRQIAKTYIRLLPSIQPHQSVIRIVASELDYSIDRNGNCNFVRTVIRELQDVNPAR